MSRSTYLTARAAAAELGVTRATLYAYVSRGLVRSRASGASSRERLYHAEDIQRLKQRNELRRSPVVGAEQALNWGVPVMESSLTLISDGRFFYRGLDAVELALSHSLEQVAGLLWTGELPAVYPREEQAAGPIPPPAAGLDGVERIQLALIRAEAQDPAAFDLQPERVAQKGARILQRIAASAAQVDPAAGLGVAQLLQTGWAPERPEISRQIDTALVLCADHELNISAFTARCVASAGSSPYAAVIAGLAALRGVKHGGISRRVEALFEEAGSPERAQEVLSGRLARGEQIPGFGHPLYPEGDPRARILLEQLQASASPGELELSKALIEGVQRLVGEFPTIDFALVASRRVWKLPHDAALLLFATGRSVGWIAHAIEQYRAGALIRPRAKYIGPQPS